MWYFDWSFVHLAGFAFDFAVFGHDSGSNVRGLRGWHWDLLSAIHWFMDNQYHSEVGSVRKGEKLYQKSLYIRPFGDGLPDKYSSPASWALVKYVKLLNTQITHREGLTRLSVSKHGHVVLHATIRELIIDTLARSAATRCNRGRTVKRTKCLLASKVNAPVGLQGRDETRDEMRLKDPLDGFFGTKQSSVASLRDGISEAGKIKDWFVDPRGD